jgi:hypothetical protein
LFARQFRVVGLSELVGFPFDLAMRKAILSLFLLFVIAMTMTQLVDAQFYGPGFYGPPPPFYRPPFWGPPPPFYRPYWYGPWGKK